MKNHRFVPKTQTFSLVLNSMITMNSNSQNVSCIRVPKRVKHVKKIVKEITKKSKKENIKKTSKVYLVENAIKTNENENKSNWITEKIVYCQSPRTGYGGNALNTARAAHTTVKLEIMHIRNWRIKLDERTKKCSACDRDMCCCRLNPEHICKLIHILVYTKNEFRSESMHLLRS